MTERLTDFDSSDCPARGNSCSECLKIAVDQCAETYQQLTGKSSGVSHYVASEESRVSGPLEENGSLKEFLCAVRRNRARDVGHTVGRSLGLRDIDDRGGF